MGKGHQSLKKGVKQACLWLRGKWGRDFKEGHCKADYTEEKGVDPFPMPPKTVSTINFIKLGSLPTRPITRVGSPLTCAQRVANGPVVRVRPGDNGNMRGKNRMYLLLRIQPPFLIKATNVQNNNLR